MLIAARSLRKNFRGSSQYDLAGNPSSDKEGSGTITSSGLGK